MDRGWAVYRSSQDNRDGIPRKIRHREYATMDHAHEENEEKYSTWQSVYLHQSYDEEEDVVTVTVLKP